MTIKSVTEKMTRVHTDCASLITTAKELAESGDPKLRALAYEISVNVSRILHEQQQMIKELKEMAAECGAMAE